MSIARIQRAQQDVKNPTQDKIVPILYRPFDVRYTYYTGTANGFHERPRPEVMRHMLAGENLALAIPRQVKTEDEWFHAFVTNRITESCIISNRTSEIGYIYPLYLYPEAEPRNLFGDLEVQERRPNLNRDLLDALAQAYGEAPPPEQVFHYIYAVLYAPSYREKYADFLRLDFPHIPFPAEREIFEALADLGRRLVALHLLESPELDPPLARFEGEGDNRVAANRREGFRYEPETERVYINPTQYFAPVPPKVWEYPIGGYRPAEKWLKDRQGRPLSLDEIRTYCRIVTALKLTLEVQEEIDEVYSQVEQTSPS